MAYSKKPTYSFETSASTGINKVPSGRVVLVDNFDERPQAFITLGDLSTLNDDTTISQALEKGFLRRFDTSVEDFDKSVLTPGELGFGCGVASDKLTTELGLTGMPGFRDPTSDNFGNYQDANKNVFVFIPKFYFKWEKNTVFVSPVEREGYAIHRAFINAGGEIEGFFIGKYQMGPGATSKPGQVLINVPSYSFIAEANKLGTRYTIINSFMFNALAILTKAQRQSGRNAAWLDVAPYYPKGNNNNGRDVNDPSLSFIGANPAHTGSGTPFAKTTHNGQNCGVADLNGNVHENGLGVTSEGTKYFVPKLTTDITKFTENVASGAITSEQCAFGDLAYLSNPNGFFEELNTTGTISSNLWGSLQTLGKGDAQVFPFSADRNNPHWILSCMGIPFYDGCVVNSAHLGSEEFGQDSLYAVWQKENLGCPKFGGSFRDMNQTSAGCWTQTWIHPRTVSGQDWGSRLAIITSQTSPLKASIPS